MVKLTGFAVTFNYWGMTLWPCTLVPTAFGPSVFQNAAGNSTDCTGRRSRIRRIQGGEHATTQSWIPAANDRGRRRHCDAGDGGNSCRHCAAFGGDAGDRACAARRFSARIHVEPAAVHRSDYRDRRMVLAERGLGDSTESVLENDCRNRDGRLPAGRDLCAMVLLLSRSEGDARDPCTCTGPLGADRGVLLLPHRIHHDPAHVCLDERVLARRVYG